MHVPVLRQAACCHGTAILDKPQRQRVFRKSMPSDLIRGWIPVLRSEYAPRAECAAAIMAKAMELTLADETDDVLCRSHGLHRDGAGTVGAVDQDLIDMAGICDQPLHLGSDRRQFFDAEFDQ